MTLMNYLKSLLSRKVTIKNTGSVGVLDTKSHDDAAVLGYEKVMRFIDKGIAVQTRKIAETKKPKARKVLC